MTASSGESGTSISKSRCLTWPVSMILQNSSSPQRYLAMVSIGFCVAEMPMRTGGLMQSAESRSRDSIKCAPRLLPARACISSMITVCTVASISRPDSEVSRINNDSGVVTTMCGGFLRIFWRSLCGVSPVRTQARISTSGRPCSSSESRIPLIGNCRFF